MTGAIAAQRFYNVSESRQALTRPGSPSAGRGQEALRSPPRKSPAGGGGGGGGREEGRRRHRRPQGESKSL
ncbi:hypothetical protein DV515_00003870 [Chloebia gouldiae]|uniref:Uncharacterized protein n=1 Tax=Chloebia gouldiae TaxID=44316 RepID=A0A3L8SS76_CHLGU|nr:hypothetical protein DV515_00003870 [Chloebia gouldiae]